MRRLQLTYDTIKDAYMSSIGKPTEAAWRTKLVVAEDMLSLAVSELEVLVAIVAAQGRSQPEQQQFVGEPVVGSVSQPAYGPGQGPEDPAGGPGIGPDN